MFITLEIFKYYGGIASRKDIFFVAVIW